ncbi:unnamed protein product [Nippostrongylus brasiliensis]|uniref:Ubiquitin-like domain-containing protein n=1 Tax=Nippostrongylus brasiliensis TaxID=27835 RepID=A0A0N4XX15_NIPBR|nr:unnamed protein product [Nippostrongylus brasiliensis]
MESERKMVANKPCAIDSVLVIGLAHSSAFSRRNPFEMRLRVLVYNKVRKLAGHEFFIDVKENDTIEKVKLAIEDATSVPHEIQWIIFGVRNLEDTVRLSDHHIRDGYTIYSVPTYVEIQSMPNL